ncbi:MAG TPA: Ku protein [Gemmataceae bacterium]|nr:Ku protein [Gemmataceae bacterium]
MALRSSWDGYLKLSLISVPVRAYNAAVAGSGDVHFHQLHRECGNRIHYKKVCPVHGEVSKGEIVSGYEYKKGKYVEMEKEELDKLRPEDEKSVNIDAFADPGQIDPMYMTGRTFYLVPAGPAGQKAYSLLHDVMKEKQRYAVGTIVLSGHDETVLIRPVEELLTMSVLYHEDQIKQPTAFKDEIKKSKANEQELKLAGVLVEESTPKSFDFAHYKDQFTERVAEALEAKLAGKKVTRRRAAEAPPTINLMEALRKSVGHTQGGETKKKRRHGRRKTA